MAAKTAAQEEFDNIFTRSSHPTQHPEDRSDNEGEDEIDEETAYKQGKIAETMRQPVYHNRSTPLRLPPPSFDSGCTTGVKGVIADARSFEAAKREGAWKGKVQVTAAPSQEKKQYLQRGRNRKGETYLVDEDASDDGEFLEQWREARRKEMMREGSDIRNRRTSPSIRRYGRFDKVDALGYLDAIEKVGRETVVVVFVYDAEVCSPCPIHPRSHALLRMFCSIKYCTYRTQKLTTPPQTQCPVSQVIESALSALVPANPAIHFVKVSFDEIEFDNAGVPAILAYRNQGDLFANLTYVVDQIPENTPFDTTAVKDVLRKFGVL
jgi:hypothetical protein